MRKRAPLLALLLLAVPRLAMAAPYPVISGEHEGFTRIVAQVPKDGSWKVTQEGRTVTLTLEDHDAGFETDAVYRRISRNRIASVEARAGLLMLSLGCDCGVSAFPSGADYAVIDVAEPGLTLPTPMVIPDEETANTSDGTALSSAASAAGNSAQTPLPPILPVLISTPRPKQPPRQLALDRATLSPAQQAALNDIQSQLAEELGAATTRGLLDPVEGRRPSAQPHPLTATAEGAPARTSPPADLSPDPLGNMRITSSMDRPHASAPESAGTTRAGLSCPQDSNIEIASWGDPDGFEEQIGQGRAALFGEFDKIDSEAAMRLARSYLYFGFGAEARQVLSLLPVPQPDTRLLFDIADIMDHGRPRWPEAMISFTDCTSDIALWAILSLADAPRRGSLPIGSALHGLNKLPAHLRRALAPYLSRRLLTHGHAEAAATALRSVERLPEAPPPEAILARAEIDLKQGNIDNGTAQLETVAEANGAQSPEALATLVETRLETGQPVSIETAELVEAYAHELRDTVLGARLRHAHVMALVQSGQFDSAFAEAEALDGASETEEALALRLSLISALADRAEDIVFLDHILKQDRNDLALLHEGDRYNTVERLLGLGFAAEAQAILASGPETARPSRRQLLAAEAALALEQPYQAQAALLGIEVPEAAPLRARAKAMTGAFGEAHELYAQSELEGPAQRAAWLAEDWRKRMPEDSPVYGPAALLAQTRTAVSERPEGMLARGAAALEESAAARETLSALLSATTLPTTE